MNFIFFICKTYENTRQVLYYGINEILDDFNTLQTWENVQI